MMDKKYKVILTVLSIIAVIAIIALIIFVAVDNANAKKQKEEQASAVAEFIRDYGNEDDVNNNDNDDDDDDDDDNHRPDDGISQVPEIIEDFNNSTNTSNNSSNGYSSDGKKYKGFNMVGYIKIPKTGIELPILDVVTKKSLEASVAILYPSNAVLNESANVVIAGHNYRNSSFFSNNKKLQEGDKIYIGDTKGRQVVYTVYSNFEASPEDTSFYTRNTGYKEITLTTCTQDSQKRTIILARAE